LKRYKIGCQLVLITNRKSHTGFRLVLTLTSVTLNDLERCNWHLICIISQKSISLQADYVIAVEDRPIMSAKYRLPVTLKTDPGTSRMVSLRQLSFWFTFTWFSSS